MVSDYMQAVPLSTNHYKIGQNSDYPDIGVGISMGNYSGNAGPKQLGYGHSQSKGAISGRIQRERSLEP